MKRSVMFTISLVASGCAHAQLPVPANPSEAQATAVSEAAARAMGQLIMHAELARQKAEFAAIAAHCTRLETQYAAGFAARRPELERQWLSFQDRQAAVIDLVGLLMSSRGGNISMPDLMNKTYRVMTPPATATTAPTPAPVLPEVPPAIQENANQKALDEVKRRMEGLTWKQQRSLCDAGLVSGALPKEPEKEAAQGREVAPGR